MKKHQTAQKKKLSILTAGQMKDIASAVVQGIPSNLPADVAQRCIGKKNWISRKVREIFTSMIANSYYDEIMGWEQFYLKHFQKTYDFSQLLIPDCPGESWRLLIIVDLLLEQLYVKMKELFPCWRWTNDNLDQIVDWNERDAKNGAYAIWVKDAVEADENLKNHSANKIKELSIATETLGERLIHELKFFDETGGKHLDIKNITLCSGSRDSGGDVPDVDFGPGAGRVGVGSDHPDDAGGGLRSREVVSYPALRDK